MSPMCCGRAGPTARSLLMRQLCRSLFQARCSISNVQRRPGAHERVDLSYMWPSLTPPDHAIKPTVGAPIYPNERLFVTIASGETTLPLMERLQTIYPRDWLDNWSDVASGIDRLIARLHPETK